MKNEGRIFDIQRFSLHDGPGIRTLVFFKGCPLRCKWCHNPEGLSPMPQVIHHASRCIGCGDCAAVCPSMAHRMQAGVHCFDRGRCIACGACAEACPGGALRLAGSRMRVGQVMEAVMRDAHFYGETGGITLSGGEPMMQAAFAQALAMAAKGCGISVCVETCGHAPWEAFEAIAPYVDFFLYDFKHSDPGEHARVTGVAQDLILANLGRLDAIGAKVMLCCPLIPGINMRTAHMERIAEQANAYEAIVAVRLKPYHALGAAKAAAAGVGYDFAPQPVNAQAYDRLLAHLKARTSKPCDIIA